MGFIEELQDVTLDLATVVIGLCEKHGIRYDAEEYGITQEEWLALS